MDHRAVAARAVLSIAESRLPEGSPVQRWNEASSLINEAKLLTADDKSEVRDLVYRELFPEHAGKLA